MNRTSLRLLLIAALILTVGLGIWMRLAAPGWLLLIFGIPLLVIAVAHVVVHAIAISRLGRYGPSYPRLILFSDLYFFLGFVLQPDVADSGDQGIGLISFIYYFVLGRSHAPSLEAIPSWIFITISVILLGVLFVSWLVLLSPPSTARK